MRCNVPGCIYCECRDRRVPAAPKEEGWRGATCKKRGRGYTCSYEADPDMIFSILSSARLHGEVLSSGSDPDTERVARKIVKWAEAASEALGLGRPGWEMIVKKEHGESK